MHLTAIIAILTASAAIAAPAADQQLRLANDVVKIKINIGEPDQEAALPTRFGLVAVHSGSPIHFQSINANGRGFWIGKDTATFCPSPPVPPPSCPPGNATVIDIFDSFASLVSTHTSITGLFDFCPTDVLIFT